MSFGLKEIIIIVVLIVLLFGRNRISTIMTDVAKGIKSFKKGMATDVTEDAETKNLSEDNKNLSEDNKDTNNKE